MGLFSGLLGNASQLNNDKINRDWTLYCWTMNRLRWLSAWFSDLIVLRNIV